MVKVNLFDPAVQSCPYDAYQTLRDDAPAYRCPATGMYVVTRFDDVRRVLTDPKTFSSRTQRLRASARNSGRGAKVAALFEAEGWLPGATLAGRDDPEHREMRAMFNEAFRPKKIKALDPEVRTLAFSLIDDFIDAGRCDFVSAFAIPLPLIIIGRQMGADPDDIWKIKDWTHAFFRRISMMLPEDEELATVRQEIEAQHYFQPIFERLRERPNDTLLSELVNSVIEQWGRPLTDNELHAEMMADTFVGGSETTTNALSAGVKLLIEQPDVWAQLKGDPEALVPVFLEEVLRLESPVQSLMRITTCDVEIGGSVIPADSLVNVRYGAANRDERRFSEPEKLDLARERAGGHMAFGSGVHHCLGAPLARRELYWSFFALTQRIESMRFAAGAEFEYHPHYLLRSLKRLDIEFERAG